MQRCAQYQAAARQCEERLQQLRLRSGGLPRDELLAKWRRENALLLLHQAGAAPASADMGRLRLTS